MLHRAYSWNIAMQASRARHQLRRDEERRAAIATQPPLPDSVLRSANPPRPALPRDWMLAPVCFPLIDNSVCWTRARTLSGCQQFVESIHCRVLRPRL